MKKKNRLYFYFVTVLFSCLVLSWLFNIGFLSNVQLTLSDSLYGGKNALNEIVIVEIDDTSIQSIGRWPWSRAVFASLVEKLSSADVVGIDVAFFEEANGVADEFFASAVSDVGNIVLPVEYTTFSDVDGKVVGDGLLLPYAGLKDSAMELAYINIITDGDGISRAYNLDLSEEYDNFPHAVYKHFVGNAKDYRSSRFLVNFAGEPGTFERYSVSEVLEGDIDFSGKIVLVGSTSPDLHDEMFVPTSSGKAMPGVEVHANAIQTMILGNELVKQSATFVVVLIFVFGLISLMLADRLHFAQGLGAVSVLAVGYIFYSIFAFEGNVIYNLVYPVLSLFVSFFVVVGHSLVTEQKHKREIVGLFGKYVSPAVLGRMLHNPEKVKLGGEKREITVFFSDIRGFTSLSEKLAPEQLVHLLNEYLTEMTAIVMKQKGVVDKYMGDAIMAFWGAPLVDKRHAHHACEASLEMMQQLRKLQRKWVSEGVPSFDIGIGLNTGDAVVGNMGSYERFDYTAMGDNVNLGSRLEGLNKEYGTSIIISEYTRRLVSDVFLTRKLDKVRVKGKREPVVIYELVERRGRSVEYVKDFENGLELYFLGKFNEAISEFEKSAEDDKTSRIFVKRCKQMLENLPKDWDGVWVMKTK